MDNLGPGAHLDLSNSVLGRGQLYTRLLGCPLLVEGRDNSQGGCHPGSNRECEM